MKQYFFSRILGMAFLATVSISCTSNLDFNQVNNVTAQPIVVANLASFEVPANEFVTNGVELTVSGDLQNFDVFRDTFFKNSLIKTEFLFEINNSINRAYSIDLELLDANSLPLYPIHIDVPANTVAGSPITKTEIFENINLDLLKRTSKIGFTITMLPGAVLTESSVGSLKLRSSATVYLDIK
jgi:hypothetical protein